MASIARTWALAHAAWTGGTFLYVPANVTVDAIGADGVVVHLHGLPGNVPTATGLAAYAP